MTNLMKALVKAHAEEGLWMDRVPMPEPGPDEVLIKVRKSAICGTDVHIWKWDEWSAKTVPIPMVTGHEFCGEIVDGGKAATKFRVGQRVSGEGRDVLVTRWAQDPSVLWAQMVAQKVGASHEGITDIGSY